MDSTQIQTFLSMLGCERIKTNATWVMCSCPVSQWKHSSGKDTHSSFAVSIDPGSESSCKCFTCGISGNLTSLVFRLERLSNRKLPKAHDYLQVNNQLSMEELTRRIDNVQIGWYDKNAVKKVAGISVQPGASKGPVEIPDLPTLPESTLDSIRDLPAEVLSYLKNDRRLTQRTIDRWELGYHRATNRIAIPIRDCQGALVGLSGRAFGGQDPKYMHSSGFKGKYYLYGEDKAIKNETVFLCEGFFDVMYLWQSGYNAVALHGAHVSEFQIAKAKQLFKDVVITLDGDGPGEKAAELALYSISQAMLTRKVSMPKDRDPDELTNSELLELLGPPNIP